MTAAERSDWPIVVGGFYRSGTSLVRRLLDAHPRIYCGPEPAFFRDFTGDYIDDPLANVRFLQASRRLVPESDLMEIVGAAFVRLHERAAEHAGKPRWADKDPMNTVHLADWERLLGDRWLFLHVVRNPLDTLASLREAGFPRTMPADLDAQIALWQRYTRAGRDFARRHPDRARQVRYEDLVRDPGPVLADLMAWLGESLDPGQLVLDPKRHQRGLEDAKARRATSIHTESVGRWHTLLSPEEAERIEATCGPLWAETLAAGEPGPAA